jgi:hypothetical protein
VQLSRVPLRLVRASGGTDMERRREFTRRDVLRFGALGAAGSTLGLLRQAARLPVRLSLDALPPRLPDIQHDIAAFLAPVETIDGVAFRFGPVFTKFVTAGLTRVPTRDDQRVLADALDTIEGAYRFGPDGVFTFVSYGLPYFRLLPRGLAAAYVPRLLDQPTRFAVEEAIPSPTDVTYRYDSVVKQRFNVAVRIEANALLFTIRSDSLQSAGDVEAWLAGSNLLAGRSVRSPALRGLIRFNPARVMFTQRGMPRRVAERAGLVFANRIHPESPMWMGFADQQVAGSGSAAITTFQGDASARLTTARSGDYFDDGSVQHLSHVILDLEQFYLGGPSASRMPDERAHYGRADGRFEFGAGNSGDAERRDTAPSDNSENDESFLERVQYMFRSTPPPSTGFADQFSDGGGPTFLPNEFHGTDDAARGAQGIGTPEGKHRLGHLAALQRSSRAPDGNPIHIRMDGPGFDALDVPDGSNQPKLHFSIFVPTADFFAHMRTNQASVDLARAHAVAADDQGIERFLTATRRQNFLVPPRRHRAFPLLELADENHFI